MDGLRWLLLGIGLLVIVGVYLYTRYQRARAEASPQGDLFNGRADPPLRKAPNLDSAGRLPDAADAEQAAPVISDTPQIQQKIVTLRIVAKRDGTFAGDELVLNLRGIGLRHGKFGIFHRYEGSDERQTIFSAASLVEPGSFDLANIREQSIPGISLFMVLPGPIDGAKGFDLMMTAARTLAQSLDAELLDESGSTLSIQRERYLREEIIQHQHSSAIA